MVRIVFYLAKRNINDCGNHLSVRRLCIIYTPESLCKETELYVSSSAEISMISLRPSGPLARSLHVSACMRLTVRASIAP
jgi:hypothetical protein